MTSNSEARKRREEQAVPAVEECGVRGPRVGRSGVMICELPQGHDGYHASPRNWPEQHGWPNDERPADEAAALRDAQALRSVEPTAARAERAEVERDAARDQAMSLHVMALEQWHHTCDAVLDAIIDGRGLPGVIDTVLDWLDGSDAIDDEVLTRAERARAAASALLDAASTDREGSVGDASPTGPSPNPCPTCGGTRHVPCVGMDACPDWAGYPHSMGHVCPDCTSEGDT